MVGCLCLCCVAPYPAFTTLPLFAFAFGFCTVVAVGCLRSLPHPFVHTCHFTRRFLLVPYPCQLRYVATRSHTPFTFACCMLLSLFLFIFLFRYALFLFSLPAPAPLPFLYTFPTLPCPYLALVPLVPPLFVGSPCPVLYTTTRVCLFVCHLRPCRCLALLAVLPFAFLRARLVGFTFSLCHFGWVRLVGWLTVAALHMVWDYARAFCVPHGGLHFICARARLRLCCRCSAVLPLPLPHRTRYILAFVHVLCPHCRIFVAAPRLPRRRRYLHRRISCVYCRVPYGAFGIVYATIPPRARLPQPALPPRFTFADIDATYADRTHMALRSLRDFVSRYCLLCLPFPFFVARRASLCALCGSFAVSAFTLYARLCPSFCYLLRTCLPPLFCAATPRLYFAVLPLHTHTGQFYFCNTAHATFTHTRRHIFVCFRFAYCVRSIPFYLLYARVPRRIHGISAPRLRLYATTTAIATDALTYTPQRILRTACAHYVTLTPPAYVLYAHWFCASAHYRVYRAVILDRHALYYYPLAVAFDIFFTPVLRFTFCRFCCRTAGLRSPRYAGVCRTHIHFLFISYVLLALH